MSKLPGRQLMNNLKGREKEEDRDYVKWTMCKEILGVFV